VQKQYLGPKIQTFGKEIVSNIVGFEKFLLKNHAY
jgi:hypothetical protein